MNNFCFSHIAFLVPSVEESAIYLNSLNIQSNPPEIFKSEGTKEIYFGSYEKKSGLLLLVEAIAEGPYQRALTKRGPSLHHIGLIVQDLKKFVIKAQQAGWKLHPVSQHSIEHSETAWFFLEGVATLIEVYENNEISTQPVQVTKVELPIKASQIQLFVAIGLGGIVSSSADEIYITVDRKRLSFSQIACLNKI